MAKSEIYQIYYSDKTRADLDPGFLPLDNLANDRPDWREYWTFRHTLLNRTLEPDTYYGIFSSKFRAKTGLDASTVVRLIEQHGEDADVISFSPYFDHMAFALNIIEHAIMHHGNGETFTQSAVLVAPKFRTDQAVMSSLNTIFCNYFVAKPAFWREWLRQGERLFAIAEEGLSPLGQGLNVAVRYGVKSAPAKVFVMERLASLLLWSQSRWRVKAFTPAALLQSASLNPEMLMLDALKIAYVQSGTPRYLDMFRLLREQIAARQNNAASAPVGLSRRTCAHS